MAKSKSYMASYRAAKGGAAAQATGLPGGAVAFSTTLGNGRRLVYSLNEAGYVVSSPDETLGTPTFVRTDFTIAQLYERAMDRGMDVSLVTQADVDAARRRRSANSSANARIIAQAEVTGTSQSRSLGRQQGRIRTSRRGR